MAMYITIYIHIYLCAVRIDGKEDNLNLKESYRRVRREEREGRNIEIILFQKIFKVLSLLSICNLNDTLNLIKMALFALET